MEPLFLGLMSSEVSFVCVGAPFGERAVGRLPTGEANPVRSDLGVSPGAPPSAVSPTLLSPSQPEEQANGEGVRCKQFHKQIWGKACHFPPGG